MDSTNHNNKIHENYLKLIGDQYIDNNTQTVAENDAEQIHNADIRRNYVKIADKNHINYDPVFAKSEDEEYMHNASIHDKFVSIKNNLFTTKSNKRENEITNENSNIQGV